MDGTLVHIAFIAYLASLLPSEINFVGAAKYVLCVSPANMKWVKAD